MENSEKENKTETQNKDVKNTNKFPFLFIIFLCILAGVLYFVMFTEVLNTNHTFSFWTTFLGTLLIIIIPSILIAYFRNPKCKRRVHWLSVGGPLGIFTIPVIRKKDTDENNVKNEENSTILF